MGFFGGDNDDPERARANDLLRQQISENERTLSEKKEKLFRERLSLEKSMGKPSYTPEPVGQPINPPKPIKKPNLKLGK